MKRRRIIFSLLMIFLILTCGCTKKERNEAEKCVISVSCKTVFENRDLADENLISSLPENGMDGCIR